MTFLSSPLASSDMVSAMEDARTRTLALVSDLETEQLLVPVLDIVNPFLWEMGHIAFFYDEFLLQQLGRTGPLIDGAEDLYDSFTVDHDSRWQLELPGRTQTTDYLRRTLDLAAERLDAREPDERDTYLVRLAVLHEDMHGEAFSYMRQTLAYPAPQLECPAFDRGNGPWPGDAEVPGGTYQLGAEDGDGFVFDNEKWAHPVAVAPFSIAKAPVTNREFAEFVDAGSYRRRELWSRQGWAWLMRTGAECPRYWRRDGDTWRRAQFDGSVPIEEHAPVAHVSWYEAEAFCNWAGRRLPTEAEWELAAAADPGAKRRYPWGDADITPERANLDASHGCIDVAACAAGDSAVGCRQMLGNVWEWTADAFYPFPGYVVDLPYREYSAPWFGDRKVLKGGAWATRSRLAYNRYRNFFPPDRNDVFAGFRTCALTESG